MPNYDTSLLNNAQAIANKGFADPELEAVNAFTYLNLSRISESMTPSHKVLKTRIDRIADSYLFGRSDRTLGTGAPSHNHTGSSGTSLQFTPSFNPITDEFSLTLKQPDNNVFDDAELLANEYTQVFLNFLKGQEETALDFVYNTRSTDDVSDYPLGSFFATNDVYELPFADVAKPNGSSLTTMKQVTDSVMIGNNQKGNYIYFCDDVAFDKFMFQKEQKVGNNVSLFFQDGNVAYVRSSGLSSVTRFGSLTSSVGAGSLPYSLGVWVAVQVGTVGILDWMPKQNAQGKETKEQTYSSIFNPLDGQNYALHMYADRADGTSVNGSYQDEITQFQIFMEKSYVNAPSSTAGKTTLKAFALV